MKEIINSLNEYKKKIILAFPRDMLTPEEFTIVSIRLQVIESMISLAQAIGYAQD